MKTNRIVLDTNVLVSAALSSTSVPGRALDKAVKENILLASQATRTELVKTLEKDKLKKYLSEAVINAFTKQYSRLAEDITIKEAVTACRDPKDNKFLELALSGSANLLISGDQDLLVLHPFQNIPIVSPADFLAHY